MSVSLYVPDSADAAGGQSPGHDLGALLHEAAHGEPQTVPQRVLVLQDVPPLAQARVRVVPLVRAESGGGEDMKRNELSAGYSSIKLSSSFCSRFLIRQIKIL